MSAVEPLPGSFAQTCIYEVQAPVRQIQQDLGSIALMGDTFRAARSKWGWLAFLGIGGGAVLTIIGMVQATDAPQAAGLLILLGIAAGVFGIFSFVKYRAFGRKCFDARQHEFVSRTLRLIGADIGPETPVTLRLDLRPHTLPERLTGEGKAGEWKVKHYANPWLTVTGKLLDGTAFRLDMKTLLQVRTRQKRNARGKIKTKVRNREALRARLQLHVKASRYPRLEELGRTARPAIKLPPGVTVRRFGASAESLDLEAATGAWGVHAPGEARPEASAPHVVAMMFLSLFQIVNLSGQIARTERSGGQG